MRSRKWVIIIGITFITSLIFFLRRPVEQTSSRQSFQPADKLISIGIGKEATVAAEVADTPDERTRGLSGRESLDNNRGMLFVFEQPTIQSFWMHGMQFPLDIIWIQNNQIIHIDQNVPQPRPDMLTSQLPTYRPPKPITHVLEVNAGWVERFGVAVGDRVSIR